MYSAISQELKRQSNSQRSEVSQRFFKTGMGEYGEGDVFIGITVPEVRKISRKYADIDEITYKKLISSKIHEERLCAILILVEKYQNAKHKDEKFKIINLYSQNFEGVNNWDLVDLSCYKILGDYIYNYTKDYSFLYNLADSNNMWERRVSIVSTFYFIKKKQCEPTLKISKLLLCDSQDLTHKAVGWMLREVGKNCGQKVLKSFLIENYPNLPRTTLRYAIEKFSKSERETFLRGEF